MKRKIFNLILCTSILSGAVCGCGKNKSAESSSNLMTSSITTQATTKHTTEPQTEKQSEFDFAKTLEQTYICGHQLSYPLTLGKLGDDFTIDPEGAFTSSGSGKISCNVKYKGLHLGTFIFKGCENIEDITKDTEICSISIRNMDMNLFDVNKISINSFVLHGTHDELYESVGKNYEFGVNENQVIYTDSNFGEFWFVFSVREDEDKLVSVSIIFK